MAKAKQQLQDVGLNPDASPIVMYYLTKKLNDKDVTAIQKQIPNKGFVERWRKLEDDAKDFAKRLMAKELTQPSATWKFLMQSQPETLLFTAITSRPAAVEQKIKSFLTKWPLLRQKLPFPEMAEMRITPEIPDYKKVMDEAFLLLMDGKLRSHTEIVKFLTPYSPPEPPPPPPPVRRGRVPKKEVAGDGTAAGPKKRGRKPKNAALPGAPPAAWGSRQFRLRQLRPQQRHLQERVLRRKREFLCQRLENRQRKPAPAAAKTAPVKAAPAKSAPPAKGASSAKGASGAKGKARKPAKAKPAAKAPAKKAAPAKKNGKAQPKKGKRK